MKQKQMTEIRLQTLRIRNFKGIKSFTLELGGDATVYGRNGTGKSTLADALSWLLFDKDAAGSGKFALKTLDKEGKELHDLEHEVEATIGLSDTTSTTLRKTMTEKWKKPRGRSTPEFSGHETTYFINDIPKKKGEYEEVISSVVREDIFRMLTSVTHFNAMKWQDRRALLLEVIGDITADDVIGSSKDLDRISEVLGDHSHEDAVRVLKARRKKVSDALDGIGPRIDEVERQISSSTDIPKIPHTFVELRGRLQVLQTNRGALLAGDTSEAKERIRQQREKIDRANAEHDRRCRDYEDEARKFRMAIDASGLENRQIEHHIGNKLREIERLEQERAELREKWLEWNDAPAPEAVCDKCGQALPAKEADRIREEFRLRKAERLKEIKKRGLGLVKCEDNLKSEIAVLEKEREDKRTEQEMAEEAVGSLKSPERPDHSAAEKAIADIEAGMAASKPDTADIDTEIEEVEELIRQVNEAEALQKQQRDASRRIDELKSDKKTLGTELDRIDADLMLLEDYVRAKVEMLETRVSEKFAPLSFKLFEEQINGGLRETCETLVESPDGAKVPYSDANTGHKILAGLRIIKVLGDHYGVHAPVFVDNAESLTEAIPEIGSQIIRLVASEEHEKLTVDTTTMF